MSLDEKMPEREPVSPQTSYISESLPTGLTGTIYGTRVECPSPSRAKNINIVALDRGWTVNVGCSTFAFTDIEDMMNKINVYLADPVGTENLWNQKKLF
jgi:hypothetical protein